MVVPDETTRVRRYQIPKLFVRGVLFFSLIVMAGLAYLLTDYYSVKKMVSDVDRLRLETRQQKKQLLTFAKDIDDIRTEMNRLRHFDTKLRVMANLDSVVYPEQIMGIGGENPEPFNPMDSEVTFQDQALLKGMTNELSRVKAEADIQERSFQELMEYLEDQKSLLASTPSIWPVRGWTTSGFGYRTSPFTGRREMHRGVDVATRTGTPIIAPADGVVVFAGREGGFGNLVVLDHGYGIATRYGHCSKLNVKIGQKVKRGDVVGFVGNTGRSTGPHLHYEVAVNGVAVNPMRYILN
ncbi:MAG: M23 family metallopeptidase [Deltaproteobacteria bacterium]|nr:M23 family metallopeptidase [Deltaproteobacteria bacterium]